MFNGFVGGLRSEASQILTRARSLSFGSSLSSTLGMIGMSDATANQVFVFKFKESMRIEASFKRLSKISLGGPNTEGRELDCSALVNCWRLCLSFSGAEVPTHVQFSIRSEVDAKIGRIKCKHRGTECKDRRIETQLRVKKNEQKCRASWDFRSSGLQLWEF